MPPLYIIFKNDALMGVLSGVLFHSVGASSAALCYTPQKKVQQWSWQTYWLAQALVCWLLLPLLVAWITIPQLTAVLHEAPSAAMWKSFALGMAYGVGGTAFGIAIRYVGFSLTYAIAVGISCVFGTLIPPLVKGELGAVFEQAGSGLLMGGIVTGALGIALCGKAGRSKEKDIDQAALSVGGGFNLKKGLPLCLLAGILSAFYGFAIDQGQPVADIAAKYGAGNFQGNVIYIFSNSGAFLTTLVYCIYLHQKQKTFKEYVSQNAGAPLYVNYLLAALTGLLWYGQFFFYGLGHVQMGRLKFSSWAIHMIMLVLLSSLAGVLLKEWSRCQPATKNWLLAAVVTLIAAVLMLTYGNYFANPSGE